MDEAVVNQRLREEETSFLETKPRWKRQIKEIPPDGGWGWIVVISGFLSMGLVALSMAGFGILFSPLLMNLDVTSTTVGWIFSLYGLVWNTSIIFLGPLCEEFGWRNVAIGGGVCSFLSLFLSVFAENANLLFVTFSLLGGLGGSIGAVVCMFVAPHYFDKHKGFAMAIMTLGMAIGSSISPLLANILLDEYGYKGATLILSGIMLNQCVTGAVFHPVKAHAKRVVVYCEDDRPENAATKARSHLCNHNSNKIKDECLIEKGNSKPTSKMGFFARLWRLVKENLKLLRFWRVVIISFGVSCVLIGYVNFQMWIPFAVKEAGHSMEMAAWSVAVGNISNIFGRISMSIVSDKKFFCVKKGFIFGTLAIGIFITGFSLSRDIRLQLLFSCCWGFSIGTCMSLYTLVMIDIMGVKLFPGVLGVSSLSIAVFTIIAGPSIGAIKDATSSYKYALLGIGILEFFAFGLWFLLPLATERDKKINSPSSVQETLGNS